ncbi:MAG: DUF255 domain-containing protein, partial [Thiohalocapsa sp.]
MTEPGGVSLSARIPRSPADEGPRALQLSTWVLFLVFWLLVGVSLAAAGHNGTSPGPGLRDHPSPYLALHADDPVRWRAWGAEALAEARAANKPLLLSSGYFACHWCHVMQRESWQDAGIAKLLNTAFIPVKIDRELHPALDDYLIAFAEKTRGQAGWPLNVFVSPVGHPFYAALYLPPDQVRLLLLRTTELWADSGEALSEAARQAAHDAVAGASVRIVSGGSVEPSTLEPLLVQQALARADDLSGGFGDQMRFPMAPQLSALLAVQRRSPNPELAEFLAQTLDAMVRQGLHDQLAGGFFRYTVDPDWQTPHFEKMLYTQALLASLYLQAAEVLERPDYRDVARSTLDFVLTGMSAPDGGLIASLSAVDAEGVEGGHYLWHAAELAVLLPPDERALAALIWGLQGTGELEAGSLPRQRMSRDEAVRRHRLDADRVEAQWASAQGRLLSARAVRVLPRDDKVLAGWNGLALSALATGARVLDEPRYEQAASRIHDMLAQSLWNGERLYRSRSRQGEAALADYV